MDQPSQTVAPTLLPSRALALARRVFGPLWWRVGFTAVLEVPGRLTGRPLRVSLFPIEVDGTWYLLSHYGVTEWVRNLRAAGRGDLRRKGGAKAFAAVEVGGTERDRVIAVFEARTPKPFRRDFDRLPEASSHPTFRLEPIG